MSSPISLMIIKTTSTSPESVAAPVDAPVEEKSKDDEKSETSDTPEINSKNVMGEPGTGYEGEDGKGEFECANCTYFESNSFSCGQEDMMKLSKRPRVETTLRIIVDPEGCCEYVNRRSVVQET